MNLLSKLLRYGSLLLAVGGVVAIVLVSRTQAEREMAPPGDPAFHGFLRVAHMGHVSAHMTLGALATMEAAMLALLQRVKPDAQVGAAAH